MKARWPTIRRSRISRVAILVLVRLPPLSGTSATPRAGLAMPFRAGEDLRYRVVWAAFSDAASLELTIPEQRNLFGWQTWHFRAAAHTRGTVRSLFSVDDQFDSYADAATLESRQYELHVNELGRIQNQVLRPLAEGQRSRAPAPHVAVLPGTRDPLGALYDLRAVDWARTPEFRAPVFDGKNLYELRARLDNSAEIIALAGGAVPASRISIRLFQDQKEVGGTHFEVWLENDAARAPVRMEAELPFAVLRAELIARGP